MHKVIASSKPKYPTKAIFLDRDGTINIEKNYLFKIEDWEWIPGAIDALRLLNSRGYLLVVVSNQAGIARGKYSSEDVNKLHQFVQNELSSVQVKIDAFYYCPHHPQFTGSCCCRKPEPGMLRQAVCDLNVDLESSWLIGDKLSDVDTADVLGINSILVETGHGRNEVQFCKKNQIVSADILAASKVIIRK